MEAIERAAHISVGRACAYCGLAILCFMVGFSYEPHLSARVGGSFSLLMSLVLWLKAWLASRTPYKRTETWIILPDHDRPPPHLAQNLIATVLRGVFLFYARYAAILAMLLLGASLMLALVKQ
jgi:hypothetical protein